MPLVTAYEAKTHLSRLLERVRQGERFVITRHGTVIAELVPPGGGDAPRDTATLYEEFRRLRERTTLGPDVSLKELVEEGRR
jgi:antitoxin (DNA-binding transcriptional repressor) of toxin-antitoxin stability system